MTYNTTRFRTKQVNGMDLAMARMDKARYEAQAMDVIKAFIETPTEATLHASTEALQEFFKQYSRWVAPILGKLQANQPKGNPL